MLCSICCVCSVCLICSRGFGTGFLEPRSNSHRSPEEQYQPHSHALETQLWYTILLDAQTRCRRDQRCSKRAVCPLVIDVHFAPHFSSCWTHERLATSLESWAANIQLISLIPQSFCSSLHCLQVSRRCHFCSDWSLYLPALSLDLLRVGDLPANGAH